MASAHLLLLPALPHSTTMCKPTHQIASDFLPSTSIQISKVHAAKEEVIRGLLTTMEELSLDDGEHEHRPG